MIAAAAGTATTTGLASCPWPGTSAPAASCTTPPHPIGMPRATPWPTRRRGGGDLALLRYYQDEFGVYDMVQDIAGNYCANIARMRGNDICHGWLLKHANGRRAESLAVLRLDDGGTTPGLGDVRRWFVELTRESHPDGRARRRRCGRDRGNNGNKDNGDGDKETGKDSTAKDFVRSRAAYEHLTKEGGVGAQRNPKYDKVKLLEDRRRIVNNADNNGGGRRRGGDASSEVDGITVAVNDDVDNKDLFMAWLIAVISDYGNSGFPVALIARRWNQIWPDRPFPPEYVIKRTMQCGGGGDGDGGASASATTVIQKKVKLVRWLRWKRDWSVGVSTKPAAARPAAKVRFVVDVEGARARTQATERDQQAPIKMGARTQATKRD